MRACLTVLSSSLDVDVVFILFDIYFAVVLNCTFSYVNGDVFVHAGSTTFTIFFKAVERCREKEIFERC